MRIISRLTFLVCCLASIFSQTIDPNLGSTPIIDGWMWWEGDDNRYAEPSWDDAAWNAIRPKSEIRLKNNAGWFWMRLTFDVNPEGKEPVFFQVKEFYAPVEVYFNGVFLQRRGTFPPQYFPEMAKPISVQLPHALIKPTANVLALRAYYDGPVFSAPVTEFGGEKENTYLTQTVTFFSSTMYFFFGAVNLFTGLVFMIQFFYRRDFKANLVFAFSSLIMAVYFLEVGSIVGWGGVWFRHFAKACFPLGMGLLLFFFINYFRIFNKKWVYVSVFLLSLFGALYLFTSPNETTLDSRFSQVLLPVQLSMLVSVYLVVRSTFAGNKDALPILIGAILGVGFGSYDVIHFIVGAEPFAWLQGIGFFSLQMSMFVSLSIRSARLNIELRAYSTKLEEKKSELTRLNLSLNRFVPQEFLGFLGKDSITQIRLGDGVLKEMTVLFSDIRSFTTLSEQMSPDENFRLLNSYLSRMAPVIRESGGLIDKYIGDSIMALFPGSPAEAVAAAVRMRLSLHEYNKGRTRAGYDPLDMGVGLHSGTLMMGTIGEENRMESTVISDAVNIASRLESLTKLLRVPILTSEHTLTLIPDADSLVNTRRLGNIVVKGKSEGMAVYEVLSEATDPLFTLKMRQKPAFEEAVLVFERQQYKKAKTSFKSLINNVDTPDPVAQRYFDFLASPNPELIWMSNLN